MKKYAEYKDSGVEWIGKIPSHWKLSKFKFVSQVFNGNSLNDQQKLLYTNDNIDHLPYISSKDIDVNYGIVNYNNGIKIPISETQFKISPKGSFLLCIEGGSAGRKICFLDQDVCFVNKLCSFNSIENTKFQYYFAQSSNFQYKFKLSLSGLIGGVSISTLKNFELPLPPINEQNQIVEYLDFKTQQIDDLIAKKERLIELLKEERTAVINQAVTKGLDPDVPMKDSGIEWLGEIPEHWEVKKLRYVGTSQNGISAGSEYFGTGHPFVSYGDVYNNESLPQKVNGLAQSSDKDRENYSVLDGDVFFTRTSETIDEIGIASTCKKTIKNAVFAGFLIRVRPNKKLIHKSFSKYYFRCFVPRIFFVKEMNLVTRASLSQELLKRLPVLLPSIDEQKEIANHLEAAISNIDIVIDGLHSEIKLLKEYRTSLINDVVTGKFCIY